MKTCLIVGASGGIGSKSADRLEGNGWNVLRSSSRKDDPSSDFHIDFTNLGNISEALDEMPNLDAIVISSGREPQQNLTEMEFSHMEKMMAIHLTGPILLLQALEKKLNPGAAVILIASVAAYRGSYDPMYATVKGGIISLTRTLSRAWSPNVRVNAIAPGLVTGTPVFEGMTDDFRAKHLDSTPLGKLLDAGSCAETIEFLINSEHLTGVILHMNGGQYYG